MGNDQHAILSEAVSRNVGLVLSLPSAGMLRHHKSRFLAEGEEGVWVESAPQDNALIDELITRHQPAAVSFKMGTGKVSFAALPLRRDPSYRINAETIVEALLLSRPAEIKSVQRRNDYRVRVTKDSELTARIWRIAEQADLAHKPPERAKLIVEVRDLSIGGMGIVVTPEPEHPLKLLADERLRIELVYEGQPLVIEGRVRYLPPSSGAASSPVRVGVQFKQLQQDLDGRQVISTLTRIVGQLQREEVRRMRLGLTTPG